MWQRAVDPYGETVGVLDERLDALAEGDMDAATATIGQVDDGLDRDALVELGLDQRDCALLSGYPGPDPAERDFVVSATRTCGLIVERRDAEGYSSDLEATFAILEVTLLGENGSTDLPEDPELEGATERVAAEWETTAAELAQVDSSTATDPAVWHAVVDSATAKGEQYRERADTYATGDEATIREVYGQPLDEDTILDWTSVGLSERDCALLE